MANTLKFKRGLLAGLPSAAVGEPLFTTDTFDLYIGTASGTQKYQKFIASGTTSQLLRGDGSLLTMPIVLSSPANGEVLKYNGTNWVNSSDAGITGSLTTNYIPKATSATTLGNSLIYDSGSFVGINTVSSTPANANASIFYGSTDSGIIYLMRTTGTDQLRFYTAGNRLGYINTASNILTLGTANYPLVFSTNDTERARITSGGNFIINNSSTDNGLRFQVTGDGYFSGSVAIGTTSAVGKVDIYRASTNTTAFAETQMRLVNSGTSTLNQRVDLMMRWEDGTYNGSGGISMVRESATARNGSLVFSSINSSGNPTEGLRLDASGNLGLGVTPSAWNSGYKAIQISNRLALSGTSTETLLGNNWYQNTSGSSIYIETATATLYRQSTGEHQWFNAPSGTLNTTINWTQRMTLDASGNLGIGTASPYANLDLGASGANNIILRNTGNAYHLGYIGNSAGRIDIGFSNSNGSLVTLPYLSVNSLGNVLIGTTTNAGYKLDVNGTMRVSGIATYGSTGGSGLRVYGAAGTNQWDMYLNGANIRFSDNTGTGSFVVDRPATFSSSVTATNLYSTGASNFATSGGNVGIGTTSPAAILHVKGSTGSPTYRGFAYTYSNETLTNESLFQAVVDGYTTANTSIFLFKDERSNQSVTQRIFEVQGGRSGVGTILTTLASGNVGIGTSTPSYKLDVTGEARVSNAIAIGTTPDTNYPFKILKNINSTVGIRFENTSTGASAFSAVQFGTDVTGGTKFANLVYSSSGITESGAYKQNGTSIINTGTGGLNLLAVDGTIRFFTSSSNGTLRAEIANDGFINHYTGTAPSTNLTDGYRQYSADITAGNAAPHFRTESGGIIKLYQQTTGVTSATYIGGAGTGLTDSDTFDGYTIAQIVKALRNAGLLA